MMYNKRAPPKRHVKSNGSKSDKFSIKCGTAQGCPVSPLIFLLVGEALTRIVENDPDLHGFRTRSGVEIKISQFADDTQFLLRGFDQLKRMWKHIEGYEDATNMRANAKKFDGLRMGRTKRQPVPQNAETSPISFVRPGECMIVLGIPFWETGYKIAAFWNKRYDKMKILLANWRDHTRMSVHGRAMLANAMIFSRFRYGSYCMVMPQEIETAIEEDAQALVWGKDTTFQADERGTVLVGRRFMKKDAQWGNRKTELGVGLMSWCMHVKAIRVHWLAARYMDATRGPWKQLLDLWLARFPEGKGTIFTTRPVKELIKSTTQRRRSLPDFWVRAVKDLKALPLSKAYPEKWDRDDARAHPIWHSPVFNMKHRDFIQSWATSLELIYVGDTVTQSGDDYTDAEILTYFDREFNTTSEGDFLATGGKILTRQQALGNWNAIVRLVPNAIREAARGTMTAIEREAWRYGPALQMMRRMRWQGGGLGPSEQGRPFPPPATEGAPRRDEQRVEEVRFVRATQREEQSRSSAGAEPTHQPAKPARIEHALRAVQLEDGTIAYGYPHPDGLEEAEVTTRGKARRTGTILEVDLSNIREIETWASKPVGIAGRFFPKPSEWRLGGIDRDLDKLTIKAITAWLVEGIKVPPSCLEAWASRIGPLPQGVGERYNNRLLTPRDWSSHFKNVTHRALWVRRGEGPCRCCLHAYENLQHLATCEKIARKIFKPIYGMIMSEIDGGRESGPDNGGRIPATQKYDALDTTQKERFGLFAILPGNKKTPEGWINFHLLIWKHIVAHLVRIDTENETFDPRQVWRPAWIRMERKCLALQEKTQALIRLYESRANPFPPDVSRKGAPMYPLADIRPDGSLKWGAIVEQIKKVKEQK